MAFHRQSFRLPLICGPFVFLLGVAFTQACGLACDRDSAPVEPVTEEASASPAAPVRTLGSVERLSAGLDALVPAGAQMEILGEGYTWAEGPVWVPSEGFLLFSDVPENVIHRWKDGEGVTPWLAGAGYTGTGPKLGETGPNGLLLDAEGKLLVCQHGDRRVARLEAPWEAPALEYSTVAAGYDGKPFNSPNDLILASDGTLYFTDPPYGLGQGPDALASDLGFNGVYRVDPEGEVTLLDDSLTRPNGIALSPDERTLYVANSDPERAVWMAYDRREDGSLGPGRLFFDATEMVGDEHPGLPDGMTVDAQGNLFATGPGGVLVFSPEGEHLGTLTPGKATANCAFGEDGSTLFMTAHDTLLRVRLSTIGLGFEG